MPDSPLTAVPPWSSADLLRELSRRGARRLRSVVLRANRRTIWSLTAGGTRFNLHRAFSLAPEAVLDDLSLIAREARRRSEAYRRAAGRIAQWPVVLESIRDLRSAAEGRRRGARGPCCATPGQRAYLTALYDAINMRSFGGRLPSGVPVRLSSRMRSRLGHMVPGFDAEGRPYVVEIALNADLMLAANDDVRTETLLHEMVHVADLLQHGQVGHGPTWRRLALEAGCEPRACRQGPIRRRRRGTPPVSRVPPPPVG
jgi:hypothetical protein